LNPALPLNGRVVLWITYYPLEGAPAAWQLVLKTRMIAEILLWGSAPPSSVFHS